MRDDRSYWNERYREGAGRTVASPFLERVAPVLPTRGTAVDVAGGRGRHSLWLAARGLDVTLIDVSDEALQLARAAAASARLQIDLRRIDLRRAAFPAGPWDVELCFHYLQRDLFPTLVTELARGGVLVFVIATTRNLERHERPGPEHLLAEGEAPDLVPGLDLITYEEGWLDEGRHEARVVARRP